MGGQPKIKMTQKVIFEFLPCFTPSTLAKLDTSSIKSWLQDFFFSHNCAFSTSTVQISVVKKRVHKTSFSQMLSWAVYIDTEFSLKMGLLFFSIKIDSGCAVIANKKSNWTKSRAHLGAGQKGALALRCTSYTAPCFLLERDRHGPSVSLMQNTSNDNINILFIWPAFDINGGWLREISSEKIKVNFSFI